MMTADQLVKTTLKNHKCEKINLSQEKKSPVSLLPRPTNLILEKVQEIYRLEAVLK